MSSLGDWASLLVAAGTGWLAWETRQAVKESQKAMDTANRSAEAMEKSALESERAARATEATVEMMKNASRPYFDLNIAIDKEGVWLGIRNVGAGLGIIRLITTRNDVSTDCLDRPVPFSSKDYSINDDETTIPNFALGADREVLFQLGVGMSHQPGTKAQGEWISSLSIFYEDQYGRFYRSRVLYVRMYVNPEMQFRVVGKENHYLDKLPLQLETADDISDFYEIEGFNSPLRYRGQYRAFHMLNTVKSITKRPIDGTDFTNHKPISVLGMSFNDFQGEGNPIFHLKIEHNARFQIAPSVDKLSTSFRIFPKEKYAKFGLQANGGEQDVERVAALYEHIKWELLRRVNEKID